MDYPRVKLVYSQTTVSEVFRPGERGRKRSTHDGAAICWWPRPYQTIGFDESGRSLQQMDRSISGQPPTIAMADFSWPLRDGPLPP